MKQVNQITPFTCGLACLESFFFDVGITLTQGDMLIKFKELLLKDAKREHFGGTTYIQMKEILKDMGYESVADQNYDKDALRLQMKAIKSTDGFFILIAKPVNHWMRFVGMQDDEHILAMMPDFSRDEPIKAILKIDNLIDAQLSYVTTNNVLAFSGSA